MTDLDYDRLLERGEQLYELVSAEFNNLTRHPKYHALHDRQVLLALLERHLAEKAAEAAVMFGERLNTEGER